MDILIVGKISINTFRDRISLIFSKEVVLNIKACVQCCLASVVQYYHNRITRCCKDLSLQQVCDCGAILRSGIVWSGNGNSVIASLVGFSHLSLNSALESYKKLMARIAN